MKAGKFTEACFHWTALIRTVPDEPLYYLQRGKCFKQCQQYHLCLEDANEVIRMNPASVAGYNLRSEVMFETENYERAAASFREAFSIAKAREDKQRCFDMSAKATKELHKQQALSSKYPFVGAAVGIIMAVFVVVTDFLVYRQESLIAHPILKVSVIVAVSVSCYWVALFMRNQMEASRKSLLEPPPDIFGSLDKPHQE